MQLKRYGFYSATKSAASVHAMGCLKILRYAFSYTEHDTIALIPRRLLYVSENEHHIEKAKLMYEKQIHV